MRRPSVWFLVALVLVFIGAVAVLLRRGGPSPSPAAPPVDETLAISDPLRVRQRLFAELQPVKLSNCDLQRFGEKNDGGYLMCANLLGSVRSGYSYGISNYDKWGCDISTKLGVPVHQYDCFDTRQPACAGGKTFFHPVCVANKAFTEEGRDFDTIAGQLARNGDAATRVVMKMDVEGAEWDSLLETPDDVLSRIDQLAIEMHGTDDIRYLRTVLRLKRLFYVVNLHFNNYGCLSDRAPFPTWAYEVLFVNKKVGVSDGSPAASGPHPLDAPNDPKAQDCQAARR